MQGVTVFNAGVLPKLKFEDSLEDYWRVGFSQANTILEKIVSFIFLALGTLLVYGVWHHHKLRQHRFSRVNISSVPLDGVSLMSDLRSSTKVDSLQAGLSTSSKQITLRKVLNALPITDIDPQMKGEVSCVLDNLLDHAQTQSASTPASKFVTPKSSPRLHASELLPAMLPSSAPTLSPQVGHFTLTPCPATALGSVTGENRREARTGPLEQDPQSPWLAQLNYNRFSEIDSTGYVIWPGASQAPNTPLEQIRVDTSMYTQICFGSLKLIIRDTPLLNVPSDVVVSEVITQTHEKTSSEKEVFKISPEYFEPMRSDLQNFCENIVAAETSLGFPSAVVATLPVVIDAQQYKALFVVGTPNKTSQLAEQEQQAALYQGYYNSLVLASLLGYQDIRIPALGFESNLDLSACGQVCMLACRDFAAANPKVLIHVKVCIETRDQYDQFVSALNQT